MNPEQNFHEKCICQVCKCGKHKCPKPHPKGDFTTSYGNHYPTHSTLQPRVQKKPQAYEPTHYDPRDLVSQYQGNYVPKPATGSGREPLPRTAKNFVLPESGFEGQSNYNNSYKGFEGKYGDLRAQILRKMNTVEKNQFQGESTYNSNYMGVMAQKPEKVVMKDSIELPKGEFEGVSTYQKNYTEKPNAKPDMAERPKSRKDLIKNDNNFTGGTSYAASYIGSPGGKNQQFVPKGQLSVGNHQFEGQSSYSDNYKGVKPQLRMPIVPNPSIPVIPQGAFLGDSTYISSYVGTKAFKTESYRPKETPLAQGAFNGVSTYSGHYVPTGYQQRVKNYVKSGAMPRCCAKRPHLQFARSGASEVQLKAEDVDLIVCATYYFQQICWNKVILRAAAFNLQADRERQASLITVHPQYISRFKLSLFSNVEYVSWLSINFVRFNYLEKSKSYKLLFWMAINCISQIFLIALEWSLRWRPNSFHAFYLCTIISVFLY